jgi:hypothetical protein
MFMATNAQMGMVKDVSGLNTFALNFPVTGMLYSCTLPASSAVTLTVPQFDNFTLVMVRLLVLPVLLLPFVLQN